jgi:hypothetical protein
VRIQDFPLVEVGPEVLAPQPQTQLPGEPPGALAASAGIERLSVV